jgi:hypothetical protein
MRAMISTQTYLDMICVFSRYACRQAGVASVGFAAVMVMGTLGCSRIDSILDVAPPAGVQTAGQLDNVTGAEAVFYNAKATAFNTIGSQSNSLIQLSGLLTDEFTDGAHFSGGSQSNIDARITTPVGNFFESGDYPLRSLTGARTSLLLAAPKLHKYEDAAGQYKAGEAYALVGYIELLIGEMYCAGMPLDRVLPDGGWEFNMPLTTDSILGTAEAHFDSALVYANENANITSLAHVGLGRARLDRGHYAQAAQAVATVPTNFAYNMVTSPTEYLSKNLYAQAAPSGCSSFNVADREGGNGLDFISAHDPRLVLDTTVARGTYDRCYADDNAPPMYYPVKFGVPSTTIPLAIGAEARLIEAEAKLQADDASWLATLNALRTTCTEAATCATSAPAGQGGVAGLPPLTDPGLAALPAGKTAKDVRVDLLFRERAFWLFGTGARLGDLRRLIRQYGRAADTVFPTGAYFGNDGIFANIPDYGKDVSFTLPTPASGQTISNPHYQGCLTATTEG